jgi:hypothetical protein
MGARAVCGRAVEGAFLGGPGGVIGIRYAGESDTDHPGRLEPAARPVDSGRSDAREPADAHDPTGMQAVSRAGLRYRGPVNPRCRNPTGVLAHRLASPQTDKPADRQARSRADSQACCPARPHDHTIMCPQAQSRAPSVASPCLVFRLLVLPQRERIPCI